MRASRVPLCILYFLAIRVIISRSWSGTCPPYFDRQFFRGKKRRMIDSPGVLVGRECRGAVSRRRWHAAQHIIALSCGKIGTGRYAAVNPLFFFPLDIPFLRATLTRKTRLCSPRSSISIRWIFYITVISRRDGVLINHLPRFSPLRRKIVAIHNAYPPTRLVNPGAVAFSFSAWQEPKIFAVNLKGNDFCSFAFRALFINYDTND